LDIVRRYFDEVRVKFFHLAVLAAVPFRKTRMWRPLRIFFDQIDSFLLRGELIGKYAWIMIFTMTKPKK